MCLREILNCIKIAIHPKLIYKVNVLPAEIVCLELDCLNDLRFFLLVFYLQILTKQCKPVCLAMSRLSKLSPKSGSF